MISDLRAALRSLLRDPATSAIAVVTLGLAVGAATAVLGVVDAVLIEPLPFQSSERLFRIDYFNPEAGEAQGGLSLPDLLDLERAAGGFEEMAGYYAYTAVMTGEQVPRQLVVGYTSLNLFAVLQVEPILGHPYSAEPGAGVDPGNTTVNPRSVALISDAFWRGAFGADPAIVGRTVIVDGSLRRILGVMPSGVGLPARDVDMWLPWNLPEQRRNDRFLGVVGRLPAGAAPSEALAELRATAADLAARFPETNAGWSVDLRSLRDVMLGDFERPLWVITAAVLLVLAVAAANVAGLLLARNWRRARDIAVRRALGAPPWSIARGLLGESLLLAVAATALGVGIGRGALRLLQWLPIDLPLRGEFALNGTALAAAAGLALLSGLVAGLTPALHAARLDPAGALQGGSRASAGRAMLRVRSAFVAVEAALVTVLMVVAAALLGSFLRLVQVSPGFDPSNAIAARVELEPGAAGSGAARVAFFDNLLAELRSRPTVLAAGATTVLPMSTSGTDFNRPYWRDGEPNPGGVAPEADIRMVSPGYFRALGIALLAGRDFGPDDRFDGEAFRAGRRVMIVNRSLAERTWPGVEAVGQRLAMDYPRQIYVYEIVGVVDDARYYGPRDAPRPEVYIPYAQNPYPGMSVVVRVSTDPQAMAAALPGIVSDLNPAQPVSEVTAVEALVADGVARERLLSVLIAAFGALAAVVAVVGVYGLVASSVASRTHEIAIRRALGARDADLLRQVIAELLRLALVGVAAGIAVALSSARLLGDLLYETEVGDPVVLLGVVALLLAVIGLAGLLPALRVTGVDPLAALGRR